MNHGMRRRLATGVNAAFVTIFVILTVLLLVSASISRAAGHQRGQFRDPETGYRGYPLL